jgi:hypothetical protein
MASHTEIRVQDTDWVVRISGEDVRVKVLEKNKKASGRGYEFRCKRVGSDNRVFGRNITRGSGAFRRAGQPTRTTGFSRRAAPRAAPRAARRPAVKAELALRKNPPASAFFSEVQEPGTPRSRNGGRASAPAKLGSLRGRRRPATAPSTTPTRSPAQVRREIERQIKHAGFTPLVTSLLTNLIKCGGAKHEVRGVLADTMSNHTMSEWGIPFRN